MLATWTTTNRQHTLPGGFRYAKSEQTVSRPGRWRS